MFSKVTIKQTNVFKDVFIRLYIATISDLGIFTKEFILSVNSDGK